MRLMNTLRFFLYLAATCQAGTLSVPSYTITRVTTPGLALPWGINQAGEQHPCFWNEHTDLRDLETFGGTSGGVRDINNLPQVTSTAPSPGWTERAYLRSSGTGKLDTGTPGGQVARESAASDGSAPAFVWLAAGLGGVIALRRRRSAGLLALAGLLGFVLAERSSAGTITFTRIAETTGGFSRLGLAPAINSSGQVAFYARIDSGGEGIFVGSGGPLTTIVEPGALFWFPSGNPLISINNSGSVAFPAFLSSGVAGVYTGSGGPISTVADTLGGFIPNPSASINSGGRVAFSTDGANLGVFVGRAGGPITTIADASGPLAMFGYPAMNDSGRVVFAANLDSGELAVLAGDGGVLTTIAHTTGPFWMFGRTAINAGGKVAFWAAIDSGGQGLFLWDGSLVCTLVDTSGPFTGIYGPALNAGNGLAFTAWLAGGGHGIFTGPDPSADMVIRTGDLLFGSPVTGLRSDYQSLNERGQIAFWASFADGREGIYRADIGPTRFRSPRHCSSSPQE